LGERGQTFIETYHPGAVALFGYNTDGQSASQVAALINQIQEASTIPMIIATDQEGGRVNRLVNDVTYFPDPLWLGAQTDPATVQAVGAAMGRELAAIGINMNLAPVADLQTRDDMFNEYRVMYRRTFGDNPEQVGWQVAAYVQGLADSGVIGVLK